MDKAIEEEIIKKYVISNKQERIIWELNSPKKREGVVVRRFTRPNIFKQTCLYPIGYMDENDMKRFLLKAGGESEVYYLGPDYIGYLPVEQAVEMSIADICIIYCGNGIGYYQGEQEYGPPPRYKLLVAK